MIRSASPSSRDKGDPYYPCDSGSGTASSQATTLGPIPLDVGRIAQYSVMIWA